MEALERSAAPPTPPAPRLQTLVDRWTPSLQGLAYRVLADHGRSVGTLLVRAERAFTAAYATAAATKGGTR